jgi:hypothetical protein
LWQIRKEAVYVYFSRTERAMHAKKERKEEQLRNRSKIIRLCGYIYIAVSTYPAMDRRSQSSGS